MFWANNKYQDEALVADALYTISKKEAATKRGILESVDIVANMSLPSDVKASKIAVIFARMRNSKVNVSSCVSLSMKKFQKMHLFSAKYEVYRTERWSKNLKLMGLNASAVLSDTMKLPWNKEKEWTEADEKTKEKMIYDIIERQLCK